MNMNRERLEKWRGIEGFLVLALLLLPAWAGAQVVHLPATGQTTCYDTMGTVINCAGTGQDGEIRAGVTWPSPRFADNGDGTLTDNLSGLVWLKNANCFGELSWLAALTAANSLNSGECGLTDGSVERDWHLPNVKELESLMHAGEAYGTYWLTAQGFTNVQVSRAYWSSTSALVNTMYAYVRGGIGSNGLEWKNAQYYPSHPVWPVRAGARAVDVPKTGQTSCYSSGASNLVIPCQGTGQDGEIRAGVAWPSPRFTVDGSGDCVTDNVTGLKWVRSPDSTRRTWQEALDYANSLTLCGHGGWRVPNIVQMKSLIHYGLRDAAAWLNTQGFSNVQDNSTWWSSTSWAYWPNYAWTIYWSTVYTTSDLAPKISDPFLWPVFDPLAANAGPDLQANDGSPVALNGSGGTISGLGYSWTQVAGPAVTLSGNTSATATFVAPRLPAGAGNVTLTFQLTVSDGTRSSTDTVNVTVINQNSAPVAQVGASQRVTEGSPVTLSGTFSYDQDGDPISYRWAQTCGSPVVLNTPNAVIATFAAPLLPGGASGSLTLCFALTVSDGVLSNTEVTTVTIEQMNHAPVAVVGGNQTVKSGNLVTLDGSRSSDPDMDPLTYRWSQVGGPAVSLLDSSSAITTFLAPQVGGPTLLTFNLTVSDSVLPSNPASVSVTVIRPNDPPVCSMARAAPDTLWPPDHKLLPVRITGVTDADSGAIVIAVTEVTQDELVYGLGDGDTSPDAVIQGDKVLLRAERAGNGNGRVYHVQFTAADGQGGSCNGVVKVRVPRDMKPGTSTPDEGPQYRSTSG